MQKRKLKTLLVTAGTFLAILAGSGLVWGEVPKMQTCPVMIGRPVKEKFFVDYTGRRVYLCCAACVKAFKKDPEKYLKNLT